MTIPRPAFSNSRRFKGPREPEPRVVSDAGLATALAQILALTKTRQRLPPKGKSIIARIAREALAARQWRIRK